MGGRTPGSKLPASPPPLPRPDGGGNPLPYTCVHGPSSSRHAMNSTVRRETSTNTRHERRKHPRSTLESQSQCNLSTQSTWTRQLQWHQWCFLSKNCEGHNGRFHSWNRGHVPTELSHSRLELPQACSYPCHAQKAGTTHRWCVILLPSWVKNRGGGTPLGNTSTRSRSTLMVMSTVKIHLPLRTATFVLQLEPGNSCSCRRKSRRCC